MENCGSAVKCVTGFLRGQPINHDTPPSTSTYPIETGSPPTWVDAPVLHPLGLYANYGPPSNPFKHPPRSPRTGSAKTAGARHWRKIRHRSDAKPWRETRAGDASQTDRKDYGFESHAKTLGVRLVQPLHAPLRGSTPLAIHRRKRRKETRAGCLAATLTAASVPQRGGNS